MLGLKKLSATMPPITVSTHKHQHTQPQQRTMASSDNANEWDLTPKIAPYLDRHLVFPLYVRTLELIVVTFDAHVLTILFHPSQARIH